MMLWRYRHGSGCSSISLVCFIAIPDVEVMPMSLSELFQFCIVIISIVGLLMQAYKKK